MKSQLLSSSDRARGVSKVVGTVLMVALVVMLSVTVATMTLGFTSELDDVESVDVYQEDRCANDQVVQFGGDFGEFHDELSDNPCALWLEASAVSTDGSGNVERWIDLGPNDYHATQSDAAQRPAALSASSAPGGIDAPVVRFENNATLRPGCSPGDHANDCGYTSDEGIRFYDEGDYLDVDRSADELGVDANSGMAVATVVYAERFDRGGTWTIGEAGANGREFSMRTRGDDDTWGWNPPPVPPDDEWRAQHWGTEDIDFDATNSTGEWIVLVHAYDGENTTIRVDGAELQEEETDLDLSENRDVQIGRWERTSSTPDYYFHGAMAELLVFDRAMTDEELEEIETYFEERYDVVDA